MSILLILILALVFAALAFAIASAANKVPLWISNVLICVAFVVLVAIMWK